MASDKQDNKQLNILPDFLVKVYSISLFKS